MIELRTLVRLCRYGVGVTGLVVVAGLTAHALAQQSQQGTQASADIPNSIDPATRAKLEPILLRARERGLPVQALTAKAAEGVLRGVPSAKIVTAVESLEERLTTAHMALAPAQAADLVAGADALAVGIKAKVLRTIRRYQPKTSVAVPLAVLAQLVSQGVSQDRATEIVYKLLEKGATPQQLLALRKAVNDDILAGETASRALDARAATVFASLGQTPAGGVSGALSTGATDVYSQPLSGKKR